MNFSTRPRFVRVEMTKHQKMFNEVQIPEVGTSKASTGLTGKPSKGKVLRRVFSEDFEKESNNKLDPRGKALRRWREVFLAAGLVSIFVDPLFFYSPVIRNELCIDTDKNLRTILTIIRSVADIFYVIQIIIRFRTAYVAPSSRVLGRGELIVNSSKIVLSYLKNGFWLDLIVTFPLPQVLAWFIIPNVDGSAMRRTKNLLWFMIIIQYIPRIFIIFETSSRILEAPGLVTQKAWAGAVFNLLLFMLFGHASGACWYILSMDREEDCWKSVCNLPYCQISFFDCRTIGDPQRIQWFNTNNVTTQCSPSNTNNPYPFGIYANAVTYNVQGSAFLRKYFYCLWWGLKNLSTLGQSFTTSIDVGENIFVFILVTLGLILLSLLIGNMQRFLQSTTMRLEEWKIKRSDTEQWMRHRHLPEDLKQIVRKYDLYKWLATRGVDEDALIKGLPIDLQRKIKRHICFDLIRRVPLFDQMDETMLDAICERLEAALCTKGMFLVREGDPVNQMFFIIRGRLDSYTTWGGRTGFFNSSTIGPGDFCGEELLTWALNPHSSDALPSSTRTVKAINDVEALSLRANDLKFVAAQFRKLHSRQLRDKFRFYSHQWRTWAACTIQAAWRRHKRHKRMAEPEARVPTEGSFRSRYAQKLAKSLRKDTKLEPSWSDISAVSTLEKPAEPDFLADWE